MFEGYKYELFLLLKFTFSFNVVSFAEGRQMTTFAAMKDLSKV